MTPPSSFVRTEAQFLADSIQRHHPDTLLAALCAMPHVADGVDYPWNLPTGRVPDRLVELLRHARCFSELTLGPQLVYQPAPGAKGE